MSDMEDMARIVELEDILDDAKNCIRVQEQRIAELEGQNARYEERIRCWADGYDPPALEDNDAIGPPDIQELIEAAPRFRGDRDGGPMDVKLEAYEMIASRSEIVAYGRALSWQQQRIAELEDERGWCYTRIHTLTKALQDAGIVVPANPKGEVKP